MLEYGRGSVPRMFTFGTFDSLFSTLDFRTVARLVRQYAILTMQAMLRGMDRALLLRMMIFFASVGVCAWLIITYFTEK
jgi:hypothetical protein